MRKGNQVGRNAWNAALKRAEQGKTPKWMVDEPQFEQVLRQVGGAVNHPKLRTWVKKHHTRRYVPESVLESMGIEPECVLLAK
jgi:hypothetical protein